MRKNWQSARNKNDEFSKGLLLQHQIENCQFPVKFDFDSAPEDVNNLRVLYAYFIIIKQNWIASLHFK